MLELDLQEAEIAPVDANGLVVDFHGHRTTFITELARSGVPPAVAQRLARHSDVNLTMRAYTKLQTSDLADAVAKLPSFDLHNSANENPRQLLSEDDQEVPDASFDNDVGKVLAAWPTLSDGIRKAILMIVESAENSLAK